MTAAGEKQLALRYIIRSMFDDSTLLKRYNTKKSRPKLERAQSIVADQNKWNECKRVVDILSPMNKSLALCERDKTYTSSIYTEFVKLKDLDAYYSSIADATAEDRTKYGEIQSEVLQLIEARRNFLVTAPVRAAYLLDQTTDISKFATASSERSWSIHDFIETKQSNRLHASRVEKLVFVYSNIVATTSEPVRDNVADDMYPDAHDADLDTSDDEGDACGADAVDDDDDEVTDTTEERQADKELQEMSDIA
ncbi:hypothetical protein PHMEG_00014755 [Phytophthora megakarya]|uniref:HAT C-terminal dimerisation domain-containing protein n=1 Tax=Phytophthora megakarya TaxID=4795 RepID=A0A225W350_9STRA|nr:hypothetical protein PHMEG_00014755 [Phytophthora megakarya]